VRPRWAFAAAAGVLVGVDFLFYWHTWVVWCLERFYGAVNGHWLRALLHASYDKPAFITETSLAVMAAVAVAAVLAAAAATVAGSSRAPAGRPMEGPRP
jgi:methionine synthase II (cobalamin-independent)